MPTVRRQPVLTPVSIPVALTISKRIDGDQHMADVCLRPRNQRYPLPQTTPAHATYINFCILETNLQIVVDSLIRDLADQCEIRNSHFLLFGALEDGLSDLGLAPCAAGRLGIVRVLFSAGALGDCLLNGRFSLDVLPGRIWGVLCTMLSFPSCLLSRGVVGLGASLRCGLAVCLRYHGDKQRVARNSRKQYSQ